MAILTSLSCFGVTVGTYQPFAKGIVNDRIPENPEVAGGTVFALPVEWHKGVLARSDIVIGASEELVAFGWAAEFKRQAS